LKIIVGNYNRRGIRILEIISINTSNNNLKFKNMKKLFVILITCFLCYTSYSQSTIVSQKKIDGIHYYIVLEEFHSEPQVWAREKPNMSNKNDVKIGTFKIEQIAKSQVNNTKALICRSKTVLNEGKIILGCVSGIGTGVCLGTGGGGGFGAALCTFTISYGVRMGYVDCISGVSSKIISRIKGGKYFNMARIANNPSLSSAVDGIIDQACRDWKNNH